MSWIHEIRKPGKLCGLHHPLILVTLASHKTDDETVTGSKESSEACVRPQDIKTIFVRCCLMQYGTSLSVQEDQLAIAHPVGLAEGALNPYGVPICIRKDVYSVGPNFLGRTGKKNKTEYCGPKYGFLHRCFSKNITYLVHRSVEG